MIAGYPVPHLMHPKRIRTTSVFRTRYFNHHHITFLDQTGKVRTWEMVGRKKETPVVVIFAVTNDRKLILEKQYRPPLDRYVLELPAGLKEKRDPSFSAAAKRELLEETGYKAGSMICKGTFPLSAGMSGDIIHFFLATRLTFVGASPDEGEHIDMVQIPLQTVLSFLTKQQKMGILVDPYILVGLSLLFPLLNTSKQ